MAKVDVRPMAQSSVLIAVTQGNIHAVKMLVEHGADVTLEASLTGPIHKTTNLVESPFRHACSKGYLDIALFLLQHGAKVSFFPSSSFLPTCFTV
jgi:ankyrin repeat protein